MLIWMDVYLIKYYQTNNLVRYIFSNYKKTLTDDSILRML